MPIGGFINAIPMPVFLVIHGAAFLIGAYFARRSFRSGRGDYGWGFTLYAVAELCYITYHLDWTVVLFAHTIAEVLDLAAFILIFAAMSKRATAALSK